MLILRAADADDSRSLWRWRNDPVARAASLESDEVPWSDHERWYEASLTNPARLILVATDDVGTRVGMVRFDFDDRRTATVSVNVAPEQRGRGRGGELLHAGVEHVRASRPELELVAKVRASNAASMRIFEREGFARAAEDNGIVTLRAAAS